MDKLLSNLPYISTRKGLSLTLATFVSSLCQAGNLIDRDEQFRVGSFEVSVKETKGGKGTFQAKYSCAYRAKDFLIKIDGEDLVRKAKIARVFGHLGSDEFSVELTGDEKTVRFQNSPIEHGVDTPTAGLALGPNMVFGAGFTKFRGMSADDLAKDRPTEIKVNSGKLELAWQDTAFPKSVTWRTGSNVELARWDYSDAMDSGKGSSVPTHVKFVSPDIQKDFEVLAASFGDPPSDQTLTYPWYSTGHRIVDTRTDPPVSYSYEELVKISGKSAGLTSKELLKISQSRSSSLGVELKAAAERAQAIEGEQRKRIAVAVGVALLTLISVVCGFVVWNRRKAP